MRAQIVLLAGPSGSGKTHLAAQSGLPVLELDHFYRSGDDPGLPRDPDLGIVDWDDPRAWDADGAVEAIEAICRTGSAEVPVYDIAQDGRVGSRRFDVGAHTGSSEPGSSLPRSWLSARNVACWPTRSSYGGRGGRTSSAGCGATWPSTASHR